MGVLLNVDDAGTIHFIQDEKEVMTMTEETDEKSGRVVIALTGKMILEAVPGFSDEVYALVSLGEKITLDLEGLTYICESGIQSLIHIQQEVERKDKNECLLITAVPDEIMKAMKSIGAPDLLVVQEKRGKKK